MICTTNYLQNYQLITNKSMTRFKTSYGFQSQLSHFCYIGQIKYTQDQKPLTI